MSRAQTITTVVAVLLAGHLYLEVLELRDELASVQATKTTHSLRVKSLEVAVVRESESRSSEVALTMQETLPQATIDLYESPGRTFLDVARSLPSAPVTDKVSEHRYERIYERYIGPLRHRMFKLLEIGVGCNMRATGPCRSFELLSKYAPLMEYHLIERPAKRCEDWIRSLGELSPAEAVRRHVAVLPRAKVEWLLNHTVWGDQASPDTAAEVIRRFGNDFDVILDDASHDPKLTLASFRNLFHDALKPGGVYIVEDLQTHYRESWGGTRAAQLQHETFPAFVTELIHYQHLEYWKVGKDKETRLYSPNDSVRAHIDFVEWIASIESQREIVAITKNRERLIGPKALRKGLPPV